MSPLLAALLPYLLMTLTLAACLVVLLQSSAQAARLRRQLHESQNALRAEHAALRQRVDQLAEMDRPAPPPPARPLGPSLNLTRRGAALRLARSGENTESIAATLQVPQNEVQLLMKVQRLLAQTSGATPAPAGVSPENDQGGAV